MRKHRTIIGGGINGLALCLLSDSKSSIIDEGSGPLEWPFCLGPRVIHSSKPVIKFIKSIGLGDFIHEREISIGYKSVDEEYIFPSFTQQFEKEYALYTRGRENPDESFLSGSKNKISVICINNRDAFDSFIFLNSFMRSILRAEGKILPGRVQRIDQIKKEIEINASNGNIIVSKYKKLTSTIYRPTLLKLLGIPTAITKTRTKSFYQVEYDMENLEISESYNYIYSTKEYSRKTFFRTYVVYEIPNKAEGGMIEGNHIINKLEGCKVQIFRSEPMEYMDGVELVGRFSQWDHSIKFNDVIERFADEISI